MIVVRVCSSTKSPSMSHSFSKICRLVRIIRGFFTNRNRVRYSFGVKSRDSPARDALCSEKSIFRKPSSNRSCRGVRSSRFAKTARRYFFAKHRHRKWFGHIIRTADFISLEHIALLIIGCDKDDIGMPTAIPDFFTQTAPASRRWFWTSWKSIELGWLTESSLSSDSR